MNRVVTLIGLMFLSCAASAAERVHFTSEAEVFSLQKPAQFGDLSAIETLFDGSVAEDIDVVLGGVIRKHPRLFLEGLKKNWRTNCDWCLEGLLGNTGDELVDRPNQEVNELEKRRNALKSVTDKSLINLRDKCVRVLDSEIDQVRVIEGEGQRS